MCLEPTCRSFHGVTLWQAITSGKNKLLRKTQQWACLSMLAPNVEATVSLTGPPVESLEIFTHKAAAILYGRVKIALEGPEKTVQ
jgi:hypothetical protein